MTNEKKNPLEELTVAVVNRLTDEGKIIDAGWISYRIACISPAASATQLIESEMNFKAGAAHMWAVIAIITPDGDTPMDEETQMNRMIKISNELEAFSKIMEQRARENVARQRPPAGRKAH